MNTLSPLRSHTSCQHHPGHNEGYDNAEVQENRQARISKYTSKGREASVSLNLKYSTGHSLRTYDGSV